MSKAARAFGQQLHERYQLTIHRHDERLSSKAAEQAFASAREQGLAKRSQSNQLDSAAAAVILESWLLEHT